MNKTYCNGKFLFKDTKDAKDIAFDRKIDREIAAGKKPLTKKQKEPSSKYLKFNRELKEAVFNYLGHIGHEAYDVEVGDGYFIIELGKESVVHFKVRGAFLKKYLFGMWINAENFYHKRYDDMTKKEREEYDKLSAEDKDEYYTVAKIFQQHEDYIDKFKPSRSAPVVEIGCDTAKEMIRMLKLKNSGKKCVSNDEFNDGFGYDSVELKTLIGFMSRHPFLHFSGVLSHGKYILSYVDSLMFNHPFLYFLKERISYRFNEAFKGIRRWIGLRKAMAVCKGLAREKCVKEVEMVSFPNVIMEGFTTNHEFEISIRFNSESTVEECSAAFDRHVETMDIGKVGEYDHVAQIQDRKLIKDSDYVDEDGNKHDELVLLGWMGRKEEIGIHDAMYVWYENMLKWEKDAKKRKALKKKYPTVKDYANSMDYDMDSKCYIRGVGYYNGKDYTVVEEQLRPNKWERIV